MPIKGYRSKQSKREQEDRDARRRRGEVLYEKWIKEVYAPVHDKYMAMLRAPVPGTVDGIKSEQAISAEYEAIGMERERKFYELVVKA